MTGAPASETTIAAPAVPRLDALELHSGTVVGPRRRPPPPAPPDIPGPPRRVLDELLDGALSASPCYVLFSGGRDSSVILAAATQVARRHGLPEPIPLTARFSAHPTTWETDWQEYVIRHLDLSEWVRFEAGDRRDALGEVATDALLRHGPFWPPNAHSILLYARQAGAATMLTGGGGDELLSRWDWARVPLRQVARWRPRRRVLKWAPYYCLPRRVRQRLPHDDRPVRLPWLTDAAHAELTERQLAAQKGPPPTNAAALERFIESRYLECMRGTIDAFVATTPARLVEPFYDVRLMRSVVAAAPTQGHATRTAALEALFSDLLPADVLRRATKAEFSAAVWGPATRAFARDWDGCGLDERLVDPSRLRGQWARERPDGRTMMPMQSAWYAQHAQPAASAPSR